MSNTGNDAIDVRVDMINGQFELDQETLLFMKIARVECAALADKLNKARPATLDVGRFIAAIDHLQQVKNILCDSAIIGGEMSNRKKRKATESSGVK